MNTRFQANIIEIGGFVGALQSLRLPFKLEERSQILSSHHTQDDNVSYHSNIIVNPKDLTLMKKLILNGDEHAKCIRSIQVWIDITAPLWFWQEMVTYEVGVTKLPSESTMHCECSKLTGEELMQKKDETPSGTRHRRVDVRSYQAWRRIYVQRRAHRLPVGREFCTLIATLPYADSLITCTRHPKIKE